MVERVHSKRRRRILHELVVDKIAAVDRPCQEHAVVTIMKRVDGEGGGTGAVIEKKYKTVADLPKAVRDAIPTSAQHQFLAVFNSASAGGAKDQSAFQQAWGALKNAGWAKNKEGRWVKKGEDVSKAATKLEDGKNFRASDYAYVPDATKPSTWKLRLTSSPGGSPDARIVGAAAAAFSPGGHRGKKVQVPAADRAAVKAKVRAAWLKANPDADPKTMPVSIRKDSYYDGGSYPTAIADQVSAVDFDTVLAEQEAREAAAEVGEDLREKWCALQRSFNTIAGDESVSAQDKITQMQQSLQQYIDSLSEQSQEIADSMTKSLTAVPAIAELLQKSEEGDDDMPADVKKQLDELQKSVADITEQLAAATADDQTKKAAELQKQLDAANVQIEALQKKDEGAGFGDKIADAVKKAAGETAKFETDDPLAELVAKASMSDAEKQYMAGLSGKAKMDFMSASPADRKKMMSKAAEDDEVVKVDGREIRKSVVGEDQFAVIKSQQARIDKADEDIRKAQERAEQAEFAKKAEDEPYKFYKGDVELKAKVLRAVSKIEDDDVRKALTDMLEVGGKMLGKAFDTVGHQEEKVQKSADDFEKKVAEIAARDKIGKSAARKKAREEHEDLFKAAYPEDERGGQAN